MERLIGSLFVGLLAVSSCVVSIVQFRGKGVCLNNAYLFACPKERAQMDLKIHYRQSGVVFALLTAIFLCLAVEIIGKTGWLFKIMWLLVAVTVVYAAASSTRSLFQ